MRNIAHKKSQDDRSLIYKILFSFIDRGQLLPSDYALLIIIGILLISGLLFLSSATSVVSFELTKNSYSFVKQQIFHGIIPGIICFLITIRIDYHIYKKFYVTFFIGMLLLLVAVLMPQAENNFDARSWITIGSVTIQTSEIAKLFFILWLSAWLTLKQNIISSFTRTTLPFMLIIGLICGLLLRQPDVGTMVIFLGIALVLYITANAPIRHLLFFILISFTAMIPMIISAPYRLKRILTFWNAEIDIQGASYQLHQILLAIGSGHWWGVGIGQSRQKFYYVPQIASDSIFAIIAEEIGFIFITALIILYVIIIIRGFVIAQHSTDTFGSLLAIGISSMIALHVLINVGSMIGLVPLTGIPLPFISLGGTYMSMLLASIGILLNISRFNRHHYA